jgi:hypothetical protein
MITALNERAQSDNPRGGDETHDWNSGNNRCQGKYILTLSAISNEYVHRMPSGCACHVRRPVKDLQLAHLQLCWSSS